MVNFCHKDGFKLKGYIEVNILMQIEIQNRIMQLLLTQLLNLTRIEVEDFHDLEVEARTTLFNLLAS